MAAGYYDRDWSVKIADNNESLNYNKPDIEFHVIRTWDLKTNELELTMYNLSPSSRDFIIKNKNLELTAGYIDNKGVVFKGIIEFVGHQHNGTEWVTSITCRDGSMMWKQTGISITFKKGTPITTVLDKLIERITDAPEIGAQFDQINKVAKANIKNVPTKLYPKKGYVPPLTKAEKAAQRKARKKARPKNEAQYNLKERQKQAERDQKKENIKLTRDKIIEGQAAQKLEILAKAYNLQAVYDEQSISLLPLNDLGVGDLLYLSQGSGLLQSPEPIEKGVKWMSFIQHELKPGSIIYLNSVYYSGQYKNYRIEFKGNSRSDEWYSIGEAEPTGD